MQTIRLTALAVLTLCLITGCSPGRNRPQTVPRPTATPTATAGTPSAEPLPREDVLGNPIKTAYADGSFVQLTNGRMTIESNGTLQEFYLSGRAANDITSLGIRQGTRIIVNYNVREDGTREAESIEKIVAE